ncbi:MAG: NERD domain-containing protein [Gammaproteobacteria bacterium]|nr:NERD domain-containing protein [Gammaproteobacteria bacterium]
MDVSSILNQVTVIFGVIIAIGLIVSIVKLPQFKGMMGEFFVNFSAKILLDNNNYYLIKNVTLPTSDGSTQIDHIIISVYGIFVIETKNMKGLIVGDPKEKMWIQKIHTYSNHFQNPLHQNYKHVKVLQSLLKINQQKIYSIVVFVGKSTFKTKMPQNVTYRKGYINFIKSKTNAIISEADVKKIIDKIENGRLTPSFTTHQDHIKHVKHIIANKEKVNHPLCLQCGHPMLLRETKKGKNKGQKFLGCSQFPQCKHTLNNPMNE